MSMSGFTEIKRHLNKPEERYECELLRSELGHVVLEYVSTRAFESSELGISFPPGCVTIALYWESRPYVFWAIYSPAGKLLGFLVHICRELHISSHSLSYLDMLLDIWFFPDGRSELLDEDEVEECLRSGKLSNDDADYILAARDAAIADFPRNVEESAAVAAALDIFARSP